MKNFLNTIYEQFYIKCAILIFIILTISIMPAKAEVLPFLNDNIQVNSGIFVEIVNNNESLYNANTEHEYFGTILGIGLIDNMIDTNTGETLYRRSDPIPDMNYIFGFDIFAPSVPTIGTTLPTFFDIGNGFIDFFDNPEGTILPLASHLNGFNPDSELIASGDYLGTLVQTSPDIGSFNGGSLLFGATMGIGSNDVLSNISPTIININATLSATDGPPLIDPEAYGLDGLGTIKVDTTVVPIPAATWLFLSGILGMLTITQKQQ